MRALLMLKVLEITGSMPGWVETGFRRRHGLGLALTLGGLLLYFPSGLQAQDMPPHPPGVERQVAFLAALEGAWVGQATVTPAGPRPYDMTFVRTAPGQVEGAAHPGASIHYWTFLQAEHTLHLRFLSTFAGNRQPLLLTATETQGDTLVFHTLEPHFLAVHVTPRANTLTMRIVLRGKPHVAIDLTK